MRVGVSQTVSKLGATLGVGIGMGLYGHHSQHEIIFFDPDSDPDPDVHGALSAVHKFNQTEHPKRRG